MQSTEFIEGLEEWNQPQKLSEVARKDLASMLSTKTMRLAVQHLLAEVSGLQQQISTIDLAPQEGVYNAVRVQGKIEGILRAVEALVELTQDPDEPEGEEDGQ